MGKVNDTSGTRSHPACKIQEKPKKAARGRQLKTNIYVVPKLRVPRHSFTTLGIFIYLVITTIISDYNQFLLH